MKRRWPGVVVLVAMGPACAGDGLPPLDAERASEIAAAYGGGPATAATAAGSASASAGGTGGGSGGLTPPNQPSQPGAGGASSPPGAGGTGGSAQSAEDSGSGGGAGASGAAPNDTCDGFAILEANCGSSGCHGAGSNLGTFAASETAARSYIGKSGTVTCSGNGPLIVPDDPPASILVQKLGDNPPCGNYMPLTSERLPASDIACIEDWIGSLE